MSATPPSPVLGTPDIIPTVGNLLDRIPDLVKFSEAVDISEAVKWLHATSRLHVAPPVRLSAPEPRGYGASGASPACLPPTLTAEPDGARIPMP